jgi:erythritol kinase (D-erythritol 1-phosphate-forming)
MAILCIDAGTSLIKAVLFDDHGKELLVASRPTSVLSPAPGLSEQDMNEVWQSVVDTCTEILAQTNLPIEAISVTAQGDGAWMIDSAGSPVRNAVLWNDGRASAEIDDWEKEGLLEKAFRLNGSLTSLGLPNAIIKWFAKNDFSVLEKTSSVLTCGSWIYFKLTGVVGQHISEASAPWVEIKSKTISDELIGLYGLTEFAGKIPPVLTNPQSPLATQAAIELGITAETVVVMSPYDILATATGCGAIAESEAFVILGTTICPGVIIKNVDLTGEVAGLNLVIEESDTYLRALPTLTGTSALTWARDSLQYSTVDEVGLAAATSKPGAGGVTLLPYFSGAGERAPFLDSRARASFHGISNTTTREDIARSVYEALAHVIRECLETTKSPIKKLVISGGGARSDFWCQLIADVVGVPTSRTTDTQVGAKGALMYASVAIEKFPSLPLAAKALVSQSETFTPTPELIDFYSLQHKNFVSLRKRVQLSWSVE